MTLDEFFEGHEESRRIFDSLSRELEAVGQSDLRVTRSQVAFRRKRAFAWAWMPEMYLKRKAAPLVLTVGLRRRDPSPRWKEVVEPAPGRFTHHMELYSAEDIDSEVGRWLREAWEISGS